MSCLLDLILSKLLILFLKFKTLVKKTLKVTILKQYYKLYIDLKLKIPNSSFKYKILSKKNNI